MTLKQLTTFYWVHRLGGFAMAAEYLHSTQSAVSMRVQELEASRDLAKLDLSYTEIRAPQDGLVSRKSVAVGQTLSAGAPIAQLVPTKAMWITANFKETQLEKMKVGQPVELDVDALPSHALHGHVESLSGATGARFALLYEALWRIIRG